MNKLKMAGIAGISFFVGMCSMAMSDADSDAPRATYANEPAPAVAEPQAKRQTHNGTGDDIVILESPYPRRAAITGNGGSRHFAVIALDANDNRYGLLVNTTDPYAGVVRVPRGTRYLQITAEGEWEITVQ